MKQPPNIYTPQRNPPPKEKENLKITLNKQQTSFLGYFSLGGCGVMCRLSVLFVVLLLLCRFTSFFRFVVCRCVIYVVDCMTCFFMSMCRCLTSMCCWFGCVGVVWVCRCICRLSFFLVFVVVVCSF